MRLEGVDTLVASAGRRRQRAVRGARGPRGEPVRVGDALGPRSFEEAIREGTEAGLGAVPAPAAVH